MLHRTRTLFLSAALMIAASFTAYAAPPNEPADTPYAVAVTDSPAALPAQVVPAPDVLAVYEDAGTAHELPAYVYDGTAGPLTASASLVLASSTGSGRTSSGGALSAASVHARS